jgi:hypothetical protein
MELILFHHHCFTCLHSITMDKRTWNQLLEVLLRQMFWNWTTSKSGQRPDKRCLNVKHTMHIRESTNNTTDYVKAWKISLWGHQMLDNHLDNKYLVHIVGISSSMNDKCLVARSWGMVSRIRPSAWRKWLNKFRFRVECGGCWALRFWIRIFWIRSCRRRTTVPVLG